MDAPGLRQPGAVDIEQPGAVNTDVPWDADGRYLDGDIARDSRRAIVLVRKRSISFRMLCRSLALCSRWPGGIGWLMDVPARLLVEGDVHIDASDCAAGPTGMSTSVVEASDAVVTADGQLCKSSCC